MKIMTWSEFTAQPVGTIFSYWEPCISTGLHRKGETLIRDGVSCDFIETDLLPWSLAGEDVPSLHPDMAGREGLYNHDQLYCVFEAADIAKLHKMLDNITMDSSAS